MTVLQNEDPFAPLAEWALETFGPAPSDARLLARANEEMAEALRSATSDKPRSETIVEMADVVIVLARVPGLWEAIKAKMVINDGRSWNCDGTGHGYHVRDK